MTLHQAQELTLEPGAALRVGSAGSPSDVPATGTRPANRYSGAVIGRDHLVIATVEGSAQSGFELLLSHSAQIELDERDQESLCYFKEDLETFLADAGLSRVLLKELPKTGQYRTGLGFKIEAALQLAPGIEVGLIHFNSVEKWIRHSAGISPEPVGHLQLWEQKLHKHAIATACLSEVRFPKKFEAPE